MEDQKPDLNPAPQRSNKQLCKHPKDSSKLRHRVAVGHDKRDAAEQSRVVALKEQHAKHLLEVVNKAEKREKERQEKLRRATSKVQSQYLHKRWATQAKKARERDDQSQDLGLLLLERKYPRRASLSIRDC